MIQKDQPRCFDQTVLVAVSSRQDGQMQHGWSQTDQEVVDNRTAFLRHYGLDLGQTALVRIQYIDTAYYDKIAVVDGSNAGNGMYHKDGPVADCLITQTPGVGLFLPIADCIPTVIYDPVKKVLALAHLGRHSTIANLAEKTIQYLQTTFLSEPKDLIVWMGPSIAAERYILQKVDFKDKDQLWQTYATAVEGGFSVDLQGYNRRKFLQAGVDEKHITISAVDTATNPDYWSHFTQTTVRQRAAPPRFAVIAML